MITFGIFCLEGRKILGSKKDRFLRTPRWFAIVEFFLVHADAAFLSWHTAKVKVVKFKAALTIKKKSSLYQLVSRHVVREGKQKKKKKGGGRRRKKKEEGKKRRRGRRREASLSLSLRHVYRSICLLLVQGPISQRTALLHSRVRSPRGNAAS